jgi:hypothetical protein
MIMARMKVIGIHGHAAARAKVVRGTPKVRRKKGKPKAARWSNRLLASFGAWGSN